MADVAPGRLVLWLPVAFGVGIALYFTAEQEPNVSATAALTFVLIASVVLLRRRPLAFPVALGLTALAAGFTTATLRSAMLAHPVLGAPAMMTVSGWVEVREERERTDRIVVRAHRIEGARVANPPERLRVAVRKGTAPPVGSFVEFRARLSPPIEPLRPGGYDFARDLFFQDIGASGFVLGQIRTVEPPVPASLRLRYAAAVDALRDAIDKRIRAVVPGDRGAIASALITGKRDAISNELNEAMYVSGLAHVLSISGYHMALVAGCVFFVVRAGLALIPSFATRYPIKKFAALGAFAVATFYLVLSGAEVATQRSFLMLAIVLLAVLLDRTALTLRTLAVAAVAVLLVSPESLVHPSFQMSFAATLALVAVYAGGIDLSLPRADSSTSARVALWGGRQVAMLILASLVAGMATTPYAAYHFHRASPYGVLANLLAMPIVSLWIMPAGLLAVLALPFGFDGLFWRLMGQGIGWMDAVAVWVAGLPGAVGRVPAFGIGPVLIGTLGLLVVCLLRTPLRWSGAGLIALAILWAVTTPLPDVLIASDGKTVAVRGGDGRLAVLGSGSDSFAVKEWLAADADARLPKDASLRRGVRCDATGCVAPMRDGRFVAMALSPEALADDCRRATVVVVAGAAPARCTALTSDQLSRRRTGAVSLRAEAGSLLATLARSPGYDRPWARSAVPPQEAEAAPGASSPSQRDATPRSEDLEPGD